MQYVSDRKSIPGSSMYSCSAECSSMPGEKVMLTYRVAEECFFSFIRRQAKVFGNFEERIRIEQSLQFDVRDVFNASSKGLTKRDETVRDADWLPGARGGVVEQVSV